MGSVYSVPSQRQDHFIQTNQMLPTNMQTARPNFLNLEPRQNTGDVISLITPILSPEDYVKYYVLSHEGYSNNLLSPDPLLANHTLNHLNPLLTQQQSQEQIQPPQLQPLYPGSQQPQHHLAPPIHLSPDQQLSERKALTKPSTPPCPSRAKDKSQLTDEDRLRNKRERNRKAAANCRRRKEEKMKRLENEIDELKKTINSLQATLAYYQRK